MKSLLKFCVLLNAVFACSLAGWASSAENLGFRIAHPTETELSEIENADPTSHCEEFCTANYPDNYFSCLILCERFAANVLKGSQGNKTTVFGNSKN